MLLTKGNTNNSDAKENAPEQMSHGNPKASDNDPNNVHYQIEASQRSVIIYDFAAERPKSQNTKFEGLNTKRNTDYSDHHQKSCNEILHCYHKTTKDHPNNITNCFHHILKLILI